MTTSGHEHVRALPASVAGEIGTQQGTARTPGVPGTVPPPGAAPVSAAIETSYTPVAPTLKASPGASAAPAPFANEEGTTLPLRMTAPTSEPANAAFTAPAAHTVTNETLRGDPFAPDVAAPTAHDRRDTVRTRAVVAPDTLAFRADRLGGSARIRIDDSPASLDQAAAATDDAQLIADAFTAFANADAPDASAQHMPPAENQADVPAEPMRDAVPPVAPLAEPTTIRAQDDAFAPVEQAVTPFAAPATDTTATPGENPGVDVFTKQPADSLTDAARTVPAYQGTTAQASATGANDAIDSAADASREAATQRTLDEADPHKQAIFAAGDKNAASQQTTVRNNLRAADILPPSSESIWSSETKTADVDSISISAPEVLSDHITRYLSTLHLPQQLYATDQIAPIRPIDVFAAVAEKMGVTGKKIEFKIGEVSYIDSSEDGDSLIVYLSKFELTNPRIGLLEILSHKTRGLLMTQGEISRDKTAVETIALETGNHVFGRALYGEALGYQIPPEHQKAYYRGVGYDTLEYVAQAAGFEGRNSDSFLAHIGPTVWAYTDPGMAESFGGQGRGIVFKMKKQEIDDHFSTRPGWQRWTVNEVMIQQRKGAADGLFVPVDEYVVEILVFDDEGQRRAAELFPGIPQVYLRSRADGERYLIENGEITNDGLATYYDNPDKIPSYIGEAQEDSVFALCGLDEHMSYEECRTKMEAKRDDLTEIMFTSLGLRLSPKRRWDSTVSTPQQLIQALLNDQFWRLAADTKTLIEQDPELVDRVKGYYLSFNDIEEVLKNFKRFEEVRRLAQQFKT